MLKIIIILIKCIFVKFSNSTMINIIQTENSLSENSLSEDWEITDLEDYRCLDIFID